MRFSSTTCEIVDVDVSTWTALVSTLTLATAWPMVILISSVRLWSASTVTPFCVNKANPEAVALTS
jgi:hypothetical protein